MCDPVSMGVATFALGAASTFIQYKGEKQTYYDNTQAANANYAYQNTVNQQQRVQLDQQKSENAFDTAIASVKSEGEVAASAAGLGLSSASIVQALHADQFGIGRQAMAEDTNDQNKRLQLANDMFGAEINRESQIASKRNPGVLDLAVGLGTSALRGASAYTTAGGQI